MEDLIPQFTFLSNQALHDKNFDPYAIEDLMKLFELEAYKAWAAMELEQEKEVVEAENSMRQAESYLDSAMESAMEEFRRFEEEMDRECQAELHGLVRVAESARRMGKSMEKAATIASKKYIEAALNSAGASMKSAWKGLSSTFRRNLHSIIFLCLPSQAAKQNWYPKLQESSNDKDEEEEDDDEEDDEISQIVVTGDIVCVA
ncbi:hypothetical protein F0562_020314 [Nyssa sinensis]|uniref:Uncharacterized protein n=1 Tax=Nyssa sinensis TaxID=561372 RepID=A0A5J5BTY7_9ASTE|nr:hypothetical protein F0562_020314 [Nyssa sinensis]